MVAPTYPVHTSSLVCQPEEAVRVVVSIRYPISFEFDSFCFFSFRINGVVISSLVVPRARAPFPAGSSGQNSMYVGVVY